MKKEGKFVLPVAGVGVALVTFFCVNPDEVLKYLILITILLIVIGFTSVTISFLQGRGSVTNGEEFVKQEFNQTARKKLEGISDSFSKLAGSLGCMTNPKTQLDSEDMEMVLEGISENLCSHCKRCTYCWDKHYQENSIAVRQFLMSSAENGEATYDYLPDTMKNACINSRSFIEEANRNLAVAKLKLTWHNRMVESREAVAGQFQEISKIVSDFSGTLCDAKGIIELKRRKINSKLKRHRIKVQNIMMYERENRGIQLHITARCKNGRCVTAKEAAMLLSSVLNKKLVPREDSKNVIGREYSDYVFCEDANYRVLTGVARASKQKGDMNGDNFSFLYPDSQDVVMMLSDGMGTGILAARESEMVIELLEQFLEAGFREEPAIRLINSILVLKSEHTMFSTVDLSLINLCAGTCDFVKIGAATAFIKRDHYVETVSSSSIPAGMLNQVDYEKTTKKLYDGDYIIMVSDGVLDCMTTEDKEDHMKHLIESLASNSPQELANAVLGIALEQHNFIPADDMTVLVTGIWRK